jgi:hypothetical protein
MGGFLLTLALVTLFMLVGGRLFLSAYSRRMAKAQEGMKQDDSKAVRFSWKYVVLPLVVLLLTLIAVVALGGGLPEFQPARPAPSSTRRRSSLSRAISWACRSSSSSL